MAQQPRRADQGTTQNLSLGYKIGGNFTIYKNGTAPWIAERAALFDKLAAEAAELNQQKERPISITLPNGSSIPGIAYKTTPYEIAVGISKSLSERLVIARVGYTESVNGEDDVINADESDEEAEAAEEEHHCCGDISNSSDDPMANTTLWDVHRPLEGSCKIFLLDFDSSKDAQKIFWHSSAHVLGQALEREFGAHLTNGPALNPGFYYDAFVGDLSFGADEVAAVGKMCAQVAKEKQKFERLVVSKQQALELFKHNPFKQEIITAKIPDNAKTSVYRCGPFIDLCLGPHVATTAQIKNLALTKNSATYFLGDAQNDSLQRVYGVSFAGKEQLAEHLRLLEEAKRRDHRLIGAQQDLFFFETSLSPGSAFWLPHGAAVFNKLCNFIRREYILRGFTEVITPNMFHCDLWKTSGHYQKYADGMYTLNIEGVEWALKPMNCPSHCVMFKHLNPSYKQLPMRIADFGVLHRNEFSGSLSGLTRVRRFQQDDAHIFCRLDQVEDEIFKALEFLFFIYECFGFQYVLKLSTRPENRLGSDELWDQAEAKLKAALEKTGKPFGYKIGDGAFYGPKIDIQLFDAMKRNHQCGTIQLDFQLPIRFDLQYRTAGNTETAAAEGAEGEKKPAVEKKSKKELKAEKAAATEGAEASSARAAEAEAHGDKVNASVTQDHQRDVAAHAPHAVTDFNHSAAAPETKDPKEFVWVEKQLKPDHERPVIVHRAILGSLERMTAILTEHYGGKWPFFISPRQAIVLPVSDKFADYAEFVANELKIRGFEAAADTSNRTLKRKVLDAQMQQWNYQLVVGAEEAQTQTVSVRTRGDGQNPDVKVELEKFTLPDLIAKFTALSNKNSNPPVRTYKVPEDVAAEKQE